MKNDELMSGFPAAAGQQVSLANWRQSPFNRWAFHHVRELLPTAPVAHEGANTRELPAAATVDLDAIVFECHGDRSRVSVAAMLDATSTDAFMVLHRGAVVVEQYRNGMSAGTPHILMSVSKSLTAIVAAALEARGLLDPQAPVLHYLPETAGSAFDGASVRHLLDMRTGVRFDEEYLAGSGPFIDYRIATGWNLAEPGAAPTDLRIFLAGMQGLDGPHGGPTRYISPGTDLLGWVLERAAGRRFADLLSELLWVPMGAENDAFVTVDRLGAPRTAGGICTTARDLARVGQLLLEGGSRDGVAVVPAQWLLDTRTGGDRAAWLTGDFAGSMSERPLCYRNQWYAMREGGDGPLFGIGIHGQFVYVDPRAQMVVVKFSSQPEPADDVKDRLSLDGFWALGEALGPRSE